MAFVTGPVQIISDNIVSNVIYLSQDNLGNHCVSLEDFAQLHQPLILTFPQSQEQLNLQQTHITTQINNTVIANTTSPKTVTNSDPIFYTLNQNTIENSIWQNDKFTVNNNNHVCNDSAPILDALSKIQDEGIHTFNDDDLNEVLNDLREAGIEITVQKSENKKLKKSGPGRPGRPRKDGQLPIKKAPTIECEHCGATFRGISMMHRHMMRVHPEARKKHKCVICCAEFHCLNDLVLHSAQHWEFGKRCPMSSEEGDSKCPTSFSRRAVLRAHLQRKHCIVNEPEMPIKHILPVSPAKKKNPAEKEVPRNSCSYCTKAFDKPSQLERHLRCHTGEKPFICAHCGSSFTQKNSLVLHMLQHSNKKPYKCLYCSATFIQQGNCRTHMKRVHVVGEDAANLLKCPHCTCAFRCARTLNMHIMKSHQNLAEDQIINNTIADVMEGLASLSDQTQGCKNDLLQTAITSSGITQKEEESAPITVYRASLGTGDSKINRPSLFTVPAVKGSDGTWWYSCPTCQYRFKGSTNLIRHMPTHNCEKKYVCEVCNRRFLLSASLTLHLKNGHRVRTKKVMIPKKKSTKPVPSQMKIRKKQILKPNVPAISVADDNAVNLNNVFYSMPMIDSNDSDILTETGKHNTENGVPNIICKRNDSNPIIGGNHIINPIAERKSVTNSAINKSSHPVFRSDLDDHISEKNCNVDSIIDNVHSSVIDRTNPVFGSDLNHHSIIDQNGHVSSVIGRSVNPVMGSNGIVIPIINGKYSVSDYVGNSVIDGSNNMGDTVIDGSLLGLDSSQFSGIPENVLDGHSMGLDMGNILDGEDVLMQQPIRDMKNIKMNEQQSKITALHKALNAKELNLNDTASLYNAIDSSVDLNLTHNECNTPNALASLEHKTIQNPIASSVNMAENSLNTDNFCNDILIDSTLNSTEIQLENDTVFNTVLNCDNEQSVLNPGEFNLESHQETVLRNDLIGSKYLHNNDVLNIDSNVINDTFTQNESLKLIMGTKYMGSDDAINMDSHDISNNFTKNSDTSESLNNSKYLRNNDVLSANVEINENNLTKNNLLSNLNLNSKPILHSDDLSNKRLENCDILLQHNTHSMSNKITSVRDSDVNSNSDNNDILYINSIANSLQNDAPSESTNSLKYIDNNSAHLSQNNMLLNSTDSLKYVINTNDLKLNNDSSTQNQLSKTNAKMQLTDNTNLNSFQYVLSLPNGQIQLLNTDPIFNYDGSNLILRPNENRQLIQNIIISQDSFHDEISNFNNHTVVTKDPTENNNTNIEIAEDVKVPDINKMNNKKDGITNGKVKIVGNRRALCSGNYEVSLSGDLILNSEVSIDRTDCAIENNEVDNFLSGSTDNTTVNDVKNGEIHIPLPKKFFKTQKRKEPVSKHLLMGLEACKLSLKRKPVHKNPPLANKCNDCPASFSRPSDLVRHLRTHTKERPFTCSQCGKSFCVKSTLTRHQEVHLEKWERGQFKCQVCGKEMKAASTLAVHLKIHTDLKPHACPICQLTFRMISHRNAHIKTHFKKKKYEDDVSSGK